ncbi:hypothetical protein LTR15_010447 [Elasticomyces elasticus]|nr:hypothetical protein LTR15_010447 [Elasticomyces elasticus]
MSSAPRRSTRLQAKAVISTRVHGDQAKSANDNTRSHLLDLPRELRDLIFQLAVVPNPAVIERRGHCLDWEVENLALAEACMRDYAALSLVCGQVRAEVLTCFFEEVTFCAWIDPSTTFPFERMTKVMKHVRHFVFCRYIDNSGGDGGDCPVAVLDVLLKAGTLRTHVTARPSSVASPKNMIKAMYLGTGALGPVDEDGQRSAEADVEPTLQVLRSNLGKEKFFTRKDVYVLREGVCSAW